jgi:hypothetical protein
VTIPVACLQFFSLQTFLGLAKSCDFKPLRLAPKLPLIQEKKESSGGESIMNLADDIKGSDGLAEEENDFLKSLEKIAEEIETEGSNQ